MRMCAFDSTLLQDRRKIEHEAFSGNLLGIIATNALELGVDIGTLDAVIVLGFPFGLASLVWSSHRSTLEVLMYLLASTNGPCWSSYA
jgi:ATP-dependent helicase YprA (DUF1998 family)